MFEMIHGSAWSRMTGIKISEKSSQDHFKKQVQESLAPWKQKNKEMTDGSRLLYRIVLKWNKKKKWDTFILQLKTAN